MNNPPRKFQPRGQYGFGIGFDSPANVETLKEALNAYNAKHGALTEPDGTVVTFEPVEVK